MWNPIRGCSRVSEGCRNCYAERVAARFSGPGQPYEGLAVMQRSEPGEDLPGTPHWTGDVRLIESALDAPLHWRTPRRVFVNSMSDLFHEKVTAQMMDEIFGVMLVCPQHTFQILTKRPERMQAYLSLVGAPDIEPQMAKRRPGIARIDWPWRNIWLGVSVEDQATADERIPLLLKTPAAVRFVSYEPALGPVDLRKLAEKTIQGCRTGFDALLGDRALNWVIVGGESGPGARPMHPEWARIVRDDCMRNRVPFFFKQWGEWLHISQMNQAFTDEELDRLSFKTVCRDTGNGALYFRVGKRRAGALLDGIAYHEFPPRNP